MEIVTSWMEEGIERGLQRGRQEGELAIVLRQLNRRMGTLDPGLQERIQLLSIPQLEELADVLLDFSTKADLVTWLSGVSTESTEGK